MFRVMSVLVLVMALAMPVSAYDFSGMKVNPNDQVMVTLLSMVMSDLNMCHASLRPSKWGYSENVLAIGHLNNAQSALRRTDLDPNYRPLIAEILERLGKIKFYLLMNDLDNVSMRIQQLSAVIRAVMIAENPTQTTSTSDNPTNQTPNNGGVYQYPGSRPVVYPQYPSFPNYPSNPTYPGYPTTTEIPVGQINAPVIRN